MSFIKVTDEDNMDTIELPAEEDGTLLMSTLQAQHPGACGLKYRYEATNSFRGVRLNEGRFYPPSTDEGWGEVTFICVFPKENKRKNDETDDNPIAKSKRLEQTRLCNTDLIVLGLPFATTEESLRNYFEGFGVVLMTQIKRDISTGQSKGYGFIRMGSYESQTQVLLDRHFIEGRWCEVKIPNSKEPSTSRFQNDGSFERDGYNSRSVGYGSSFFSGKHHRF